MKAVMFAVLFTLVAGCSQVVSPPLEIMCPHADVRQADSTADATPEAAPADEGPRTPVVVFRATDGQNLPLQASIFWRVSFNCEAESTAITLCCYDHPDPRCPTPVGRCDAMDGAWHLPWPDHCERANALNLTITPGMRCTPVRMMEAPVSRSAHEWTFPMVCLDP